MSRLAVGDLIDVEAATPGVEPPREIRPGVAARKTACLWVGFGLERPPVFSVSTGPLTAPVREIGYGLVAVLDKAKGLPFLRKQAQGTIDSPGMVRRRYRAFRSYLAAGLMLPDYEPSQNPHLHWTGKSPAFEVSRQIIEFTEQRGDPIRLICHVLAPRENDTTLRLIGEFFTSTEGGSTLCDYESHLCLVGRSSFRIGRRHYWEIVVGPIEGLADVDVSAVVGKTHAQELSSTWNLTQVNDMKLTPALDVRRDGRQFDSAETKGFDDRTRADWDFMSNEIAQAIDAGVDLDDEFAEDLAHRRLEYARTALAGEKPGPTIESSRRIVQDVLAIHRLAGEKRNRSI